jgi:type II secretory pathway pseudopilin PulG
MKKNKGFTIIELGVVIALMGLIAIVLMPFVKKVQKKAHQAACISNLQKISLGLRVYAFENEGSVPSDISFLYTKGYVDSENVFDCPFSAHRGTAKEPDYEYIKGVDFNSPDNIQIVRDEKGGHPNGARNVLFLNGEIRNLESE